MKPLGWPFPLQILAILTLTASPAAAGQPVGLVLNVHGSTRPAVAPYTELLGPSTVTLGPGTVVTLVHYKTCRIIVVSGGQIFADADRVSLSGGHLVKASKTECPQERKLGTTGGSTVGTAGIVVRAMHMTPRLTAHPRIVLTGSAALRFQTAVLRRNGKSLGEMQVDSHLVAWPSSRPSLSPGNGYVILLTSADGKRSVDYAFTVAEPGTSARAAAILRID